MKFPLKSVLMDINDKTIYILVCMYILNNFIQYISFRINLSGDEHVVNIIQIKIHCSYTYLQDR